ncbi:MAG: ComF family protein [Candidatus Omnitrophica bacterium]|nr:ComF family protein [Candidatus Omnitrophota bacterium]
MPLPQSLLTGLLDIIFPRNCILCRGYHPLTAHDPLCPDCYKKLPWNKTPLSLRSTPSIHFDRSLAILHYKGHAQTLLKQFKFHNKTSIRRTISRLFRDFIKLHSLDIGTHALIIPMPLHPTRLRERGYNQSTLIAQGIADTLNMPLCEDILERHRATAHQSQLHAKDRWTNVGHAFRILPLADIVGREILLIDDILTTGATASEAAKTLKEAGASRVTVITLAITACGSCTTTS